jgi:glutathione-independent formaldehyde dehydrogenase
LTGICLNVNGDRAGGAYGYVDMGGWIGGQAEYVMVPYADFNLLKFLTKSKPWKILDLTMLTDIQPVSRSGYGRCEAGSVVYIAGAGPVGLACASSCQLLGAAIVGDLNEERLAHARSFGCETINLTNGIPCKNKSL